MDFNRIGEGATVYLPIFQPGAMLFLGDSHALQGDGETTQWALETSLDVEFSVEVLAARPLSSPRVAEASLILGAAAEYRVVTLAGRNAGMALSLAKIRLRDIPRIVAD